MANHSELRAKMREKLIVRGIEAEQAILTIANALTKEASSNSFAKD